MDNQRAKELLSFNRRLEERVAKEVEKNRQKDQQLIQQSRLAQMGEMISMIAHQWRQPLSSISSASAAIKLKVMLGKLDKEKAIELSDNISRYSQHLSVTIDDFRDFFKSNKEKTKTNYTELLESVLGIVEISINNKNIKIEKDYNSDIIFKTYTNELKQVVLNLIKNAEDILIEREIKDPVIKIKTDGKILEICDNGGGVPEEIIAKIFDPYFSTKLDKNGTGLGLYMSKTIMEEHCEGKLDVKNKPEGACFTIVLNATTIES
jgi:signal transduction histidine kinase